MGHPVHITHLCLRPDMRSAFTTLNCDYSAGSPKHFSPVGCRQFQLDSLEAQAGHENERTRASDAMMTP